MECLLHTSPVPDTGNAAVNTKQGMKETIFINLLGLPVWIGAASKQSLLYATKFHQFSHLSLFWACFLGNFLQGFPHTRHRTSQSSPSSSCPSQQCLFIKLPTPFWIKTKRAAFCTNREAKKCSREISSITGVSLELLKVTILSRDTQLSAKAPVCLLKCQHQTLY